MAKLDSDYIVGIVIAALLAGILLPIGLTELVNITNAAVTVNGTTTTFGAIAPAAVVTLLGTVVPIVIGVALLIRFLKSK